MSVRLRLKRKDLFEAAMKNFSKELEPKEILDGLNQPFSQLQNVWMIVK